MRGWLNAIVPMAMSQLLTSLCRMERSHASSDDHEQTGPAHRIRGSATIGIVQVETLEQIAERLGWAPDRLAEARAREASSSPPTISESDHARAKALSESLDRTRRALDEAS